jgi:protein-L-isoaspartate(D-aspartate) O-methyltransferase
LARAAFAQDGVPDVQALAAIPAKAQYDVVLVGGACETQPSSLFGHVAPGGRLIAIEGLGRAARVILYRHAGETLTGRPVFDAAAPALTEFRKAEAFVF